MYSTTFVAYNKVMAIVFFKSNLQLGCNCPVQEEMVHDFEHWLRTL